MTVIDADSPLPDARAARAWLSAAGEPQLSAHLGVLEWVLHALRVSTADPDVRAPAREQLLIARVGYGEGEQVADGRWLAARELSAPVPRRRRARLLEPQARLAAALARRSPPLICEDLALRARVDLDHGRERAAALQLRIAVEAALAQLHVDMAPDMAERIAQLERQQQAVSAAARAALSGELDAGEREAVAVALTRLEAALRARAAAQ